MTWSAKSHQKKPVWSCGGWCSAFFKIFLSPSRRLVFLDHCTYAKSYLNFTISWQWAVPKKKFWLCKRLLKKPIALFLSLLGQKRWLKLIKKKRLDAIQSKTRNSCHRTQNNTLVRLFLVFFLLEETLGDKSLHSRINPSSLASVECMILCNVSSLHRLMKPLYLGYGGWKKWALIKYNGWKI